MNKFFKIYLQLKERINSREYKVNELLPSENDLAREFEVSRETVRKALLLLLESGYIQKIQGKGSVVLDIHKCTIPVTGLVSFKELQSLQNTESITKVIKNEKIEAPKFLIDLGLAKKGDEVLYLVRQRIVDGESIILDKDYIMCSQVKELPTKKMEQSLYEYLEEDLGIKISYANKNFIIEPITEDDKRYVDLKGDNRIAVVRSDIYTEGTEFLHYTESRHRLDKFYFSEFARRNNKQM